MPLLAAQGDLPGGAGQLAPWQGFARRGKPAGGPAALGARRRLGVVGPHVRVKGEVLLQEPGGEFAVEGASAALTLGEGDEGRGLVAVEVEVEGGAGLLEPLLAEMLAVVAGAGGGCAHDGLPRRWKGVLATLRYLRPPGQLQ
jgi:hypothetical protein